MLETEFSAWVYFLLAMVLCHSATARIMGLLPWSIRSKRTNTPWFFAAATAPFLLGFISIAALILLPAKSHVIHKNFIFGILMIINIVAYTLLPSPRKPQIAIKHKRFARDEKTALFLIAALGSALLINSMFIPLAQNDALEYATTGRIIFDTRTLDNYPPIEPEKYPSGFYGPWTHPPLYIALIYAVELMQGHASSPSLTRLLSPWFTLLAAGLVFAAGAHINRRTGLLAAALFLSTPLIFMSAATSLIDPLPVLGLAMIFISIFSFTASPFLLGLLQGSILGIVMWSHSQAILFPLLLIAAIIFYNGINRWKILAVQFFGLICSCSIYALWPYFKNYQKIGSLISDTPLVFSLKELTWDDYFIIARGVEGITAQIQYGVFKGWFNPESYGLIFWILIISFIFFLSSSRIKSWFVSNPPYGSASPKAVLWAAIAVVLSYHAGVVLSLVLGINQMVRIERYMLIILPCVALLSGWALSICLSSAKPLPKNFGWFILSLVAIEFAILFVQPFKANGLNLSTIGQKQEKTLLEQPQMRVMAFIRNNTPPDALVLALEASDMYYSGRRMISNLDPRLVDFYKARSPQQGFNVLKKLGITHVYVVASAQPTFYNSVLQEILADPKYAELAYTAAGNELYALDVAGNSANPARKQTSSFDFSPDSIVWKRTRYFIIGGRKALARILLSSEAMKENRISETHMPFSLFQRDISTLLQTAKLIPVKGGSEYKIDVRLKGHGLVRFWLTQYDAWENPIRESGYNSSPRVFLSETILGEKGTDRNFLYRFKALPDAKYIQIGIEHFGNSWLLISAANLHLLPTAAPH